MLDSLYRMIEKITLPLKSLYIYTACIYGLIQITGIHLGFIVLLASHQHPEDVLSLLKLLIVTAKMNISDVYQVLKKTHFNELPIHTLQSNIELYLKSHIPPLSADILQQNIVQTPTSHTAKLQNHKRQQHDPEGAHEPSITLSASVSVHKLMQRYPNAQNNYTGLLKSQTNNFVQFWDNYDKRHEYSPEDQALIANGLKLINDFIEKDSLTGLTLNQMVNLTWHAICDPSQDVWLDDIWASLTEAKQKELAPKDRKLRLSNYFSTLKKIGANIKPNHNLELQNLITSLQITNISDLMQIDGIQSMMSLKTLHNMSNFKNIQEVLDSEKANKSSPTLCFNGISSDLLETLDRAHMDVELVYDDADSYFTTRLKELYSFQFHRLSADMQDRVKDKGYADTLVINWINDFHENMENTLINEFTPSLTPERIKTLCQKDYLPCLEIIPLEAASTSTRISGM